MCLSEIQITCVLLFVAHGHEGLCGHRLGHPSGTEAQEGHHGAWAGHGGCYQTVQ